MNLSNLIAQLLLEQLEIDGYTEIQRNELAERLGCVPSQINYVISSRFTPEHGYIVESRRGGGGYIRITRAELSPKTVKMHVINSIGSEIDENTCKAHILNLSHQNFLSKEQSKIIMSAISENAYRCLPVEYRDIARAAIFKQILLEVM